MALEILKLAINVATTVLTTPDVQKFFYVVTTPVAGGGSLVIDADDFMNDSGTVGVTLPDLSLDNSYFIVYVNGVQVMQDLLTYTPGGTGTGSLEISVPVGSNIIANSPVVLEVVNFDPDAQTTVNT